MARSTGLTLRHFIRGLMTLALMVGLLIAPLGGTARASGGGVLLLADVDNTGTDALQTALESAGFSVVRVTPEYSWDGTNPPLSSFSTVVHLNGTTYSNPLPVPAQLALVSFVQNGGGYIGGQWNGYERVQGFQVDMNDLVLQGWGTGQGLNLTWSTVPGQESHPVLAGIPASFVAPGLTDYSPEVVYAPQPSTRLMSTQGGPGVIVREFGTGRVVNFSTTANYAGAATLLDPTIQQLYVNSVRWTQPAPTLYGSSSTGTNPGSIFTIDTSTGAATLLGPTGYGGNITDVATDPTTGVLYAIRGGSANDGALLMTIDPATGGGTAVGFLIGPGFNGNVGVGGSDALAFASDGTLYAGGWNGGTTVYGKLLEVDKHTGAVLATKPIAGFTHLAGLAFSPAGVLWTSRGGNAPGQINTVDTVTGALTSTLFLSDSSARITDIAFAADGTLYGSNAFANQLITIDTTTGNITVVGSYGVDVSKMSGLGFGPGTGGTEPPPANDPPTGSAGGPYSGDEGWAITMSIATASDPEGDPLTLSWSVNDAACSFSDTSVLNPDLTCNDDGSYIATLSVDDGNNPPITSDAAVVVDNVAPTASFGSDGPVDEGSSFTLTLEGPADPSLADTAAGFTYRFDCGDGTGFGAWSTSNSRVCPTSDDEVRSVSGEIRDKDLGSNVYTSVVTVNNAAPVVEAGADQLADEGEEVSLDPSTFTDLGAFDTHNATVDWGDGTPLESGTVTPGGAAAGDGTVYVVSRFNSVVAIDAATGIQTVVSSGAVVCEARMMTLDEATRELFIADACGQVVRVDIATGAESVLSSGGFLSFTWGIDLESSGDIVVLDYYGGVIRVDRTTGAQSVVATASGCRYGLAIAASGDILVTDVCSWELLSIDPVSGAATTLATDIRDAYDITIDGTGDIFVVEQSRSGQITRVDPIAGTKTIVSTGSSLVTSCSYGIAGDGELYTTDYCAGRVAATDADTGAQSVLTSGGNIPRPLGIATGDGSGPAAVSASHVYADNGSYTVEVCVEDDDGGQGCDTLIMTIGNVIPTLEAGADQATSEGTSISLAPATFADAGVADTHTATIDWGDGSALTSGVVTENPTGPPGSTTPAAGAVDGSHSYADNGSYTVRVCVKDDEGAETCDTLTVTVSNVAPVLSNVSGDTIVENGIATVFGDITDPGSIDTLTLVIDWGEGSPESFSLAAGTTSFSRTHRYLDDNPAGTPSDNYAIQLSVTDKDAGTDTDSTTVTVNNVVPGALVDNATSTVQYSDPIAHTTFTATDVAGDALAMSLSWSSGGAFTAGLPAQLSATASACTVDALANTNTCMLTVTGIADVAPGTYMLRATIIDDDAGVTSIDTVITVTQEDARSIYTGPLFLASEEGGAFAVTLMATVRDITVVGGDPDTDSDAGDITNVSVHFEDDTGATLCAASEVTLVFASDNTVGSASCVYSGSLGNNDEELPLEVRVVVDDHYTDTSDNEVVVLIVRPGQGKITGGGQLETGDSAGVYAAGAGLPINYGFNAMAVVNNNGKKTQLRGRATIIVRGADGHKYKIKSNALVSLGVDLDPDGDGNTEEEPFYAEFEAKANVNDVTDPLNPISLGGNLLLQLRMTDNGEPGEDDTISFTLWDDGQLLFSSSWDGAQSSEQLVARGNLQVY